jgi:hypothetical protein
MLKKQKKTEAGEQGKDMEFTKFVRKPFVVEGLEITKENISEVAKFIGELREVDGLAPYIIVDERFVPNVDRVYIGYYMTKMGSNVRCYSRNIFRKQFIEQTDQMRELMNIIDGRTIPAEPSEVVEAQP